MSLDKDPEHTANEAGKSGKALQNVPNNVPKNENIGTDKDALEKAGTWRTGLWGDGSTPAGRANIFCDTEQATIAEALPVKVAEAIVAAHNATLLTRLTALEEDKARLTKVLEPIVETALGLPEQLSDSAYIRMSVFSKLDGEIVFGNIRVRDLRATRSAIQGGGGNG